MSSRDITIAGYLFFLAIAIGMSLLARQPGSRLPTIGQVLTRIMHSRTGRIAVVAWWAFLGLHLFSK
jgi:hypothetical protein